MPEMDAKALADAVMSRRGEVEGAAEEDEESSEFEVAGSNVMDAMRNDDPQAFSSALKEFVQLCRAGSKSDA